MSLKLARFAMRQWLLRLSNGHEVVAAFDPLVVVNMVHINTLAVVARLPVIYNQRMYVEAGGLTSYGPDYRDLFRRAADFVDKILRGAKLADLAVEQPTKFELVIARWLGLLV